MIERRQRWCTVTFLEASLLEKLLVVVLVLLFKGLDHYS
jgi:hypothetical protein